MLFLGSIGDCQEKKIVFKFPTREEEPAGSMMRVLRFTKLGYTIDSYSLSGIIAKLVDGSKKQTHDGIPYDTAHAVHYSLARVGAGS